MTDHENDDVAAALPDSLRELDRDLRALQFEPRASLGPEILGRFRQGERRAAPAEVIPLRRVRSRRLQMIGLAAGLVLVSGLAAAVMFGPLAKPARIDHCCVDLDGQDLADDGLLVETTGGARVRKLMVYEDLDGDGRYSPGDRVSFSRSGAPTLVPDLAEGLMARRFCCVDYDGGGPADDGLLVVNRPGGGIVMAAIYETSPSATRGGTVQPPLR